MCLEANSKQKKTCLICGLRIIYGKCYKLPDWNTCSKLRQTSIQQKRCWKRFKKEGQLFLVEFARCFCSVKVKLTIQSFRFVDLFSKETTLFRQEGITDAL